MKRSQIWVALVSISLLSCKDKAQETHQPTSDPAATAEITTAHPGQKLMETRCYLCHSPSAPEHEGRIGPPMVAIKAHYITEETTKDQFVAELWEFLQEPTEEKAKMRGAVERFGVMPYQPFKKEEIEQIGEFMFDYRIEEPDWFREHWMKGHGEGMRKGSGQHNRQGNDSTQRTAKGKGRSRAMYINRGKDPVGTTAQTPGEIGLRYALDTKKILGQNLMSTMQEDGPLAAVRFCNIQAYPLTDSVARTYNAVIRRVSDRPRNPENQANAKELERIEGFKKQVAEGADIQPVVETRGGEHQFYYPITTNSMCLKCHGSPDEQIQPETMKALKELYPADQAIDYDVNQVRGIWSITFKAESK